jgi:LuxR family maltose regulon positive regulatory protein
VKTARWAEFHALPPVAPPSAESRTGLLTAIYETFVRGVAEFSQGHAGAAEQQYLRCIALGARVREFSGAMTLAAGPYAELLYETDRADAAAALLRDGNDEWLGGTSVDTVLRGSKTAARLAWRRGDFDTALDLLERAEAIGLTRDWPRLVAGVLFERLRLNLRTGRQPSALGLLKRLEHAAPAPGAARMSAIADSTHYLCMAQLLVGIEQNRPQAAIRSAEGLFAQAVACGAHMLAIRIGSLLACACVASRSIGPALRVFHRVVDLAEPAGLLGSIADAGPEVMTLAAHAEAEVTEGPGAARRREFLARIRSAAAPLWFGTGTGPSRDQALRSLLTPREREILELIAEGQSNKAIARELNLGPETVKSHLKHVFAKLGVERRTQAVLRAGELGLVKSRARL